MFLDSLVQTRERWCCQACASLGAGTAGLPGVHDALRLVVAFHRLKAAAERRKPEEANLVAEFIFRNVWKVLLL